MSIYAEGKRNPRENNRMRRIILIILGIALIWTHAPDSLLAIPSDLDTDGDGIPDVQEDANGNGITDTGETNPYDADSDGGGEADGSEIKAKRNPFDKTDDFTYDADGDGWVNGIEIQHGSDPKKSDTDGDGVIDAKDPFPLDAKFSVDANGNGLPDEWEKSTQLEKQPIPQTKSDDPDGDGLNNAQELARGTNPVETDSDLDGVDDATELNLGTDPKENACLEYYPTDTLFTDMDTGHWSFPFVTLLKDILVLPNHIPLIKGYPEANTFVFRPNQAVTRYEFLKMVTLSTCMHLIGNTEREKEFSDIDNAAPHNESADTALRRQVIYTAVHNAVVEGYDDGTFRPNDPVNRAEAVKILTLAALIAPEALTGATLFPDVQLSDWFAPYIAAAVSHEIVTGYDDGLFRPGQSITRAEAAKIITVVMRQNPLINGYVLPSE